MFVGWFKIEGHSNPKSKKGFEKLSQMLKKQQRLGRGVIYGQQSRNFKRKNKSFEKMYKAFVVVLSIISFLIIAQILYKTESSVISVMKKEHVNLDGTNEFISKVDISIREAKKKEQIGDYDQAYFWYKEAYKFGTANKEVFRGLINTSKKLCNTQQKYCLEILEWEEVMVRINNRESE